ncbi:MAG TPA: hypothetical protein VG963_13830 [Polyangiaceae bacterium]|nr:hypothetical protein [Polyangiaceae bacterium]
MACDIFTSGRVMLVVWGKPELRDLARVDEAARVAYERHGPLIFIARVPAHAVAPDEDLRGAMAKLLERFTARCATYHTVLEGSGFFAAAKRTALATLFLMTGKRSKHFVHSRCDDVPTALPHELRAELRDALRLFRARRWLDDLRSLPPGTQARAG